MASCHFYDKWIYAKLLLLPNPIKISGPDSKYREYKEILDEISTYKSKITGATKIHTNEGQLYEDTFKGISDKLNFYDKTTYDVVDSIANVYNRLVMFNSKSIHAATSYFGDTINNSRFFHIFFFDI